jgi:hypothetical protein
MALEDKEIPEEVTVEDKVKEVIEAHLDEEGELPCTGAFAAARELSVAPLNVGRTADILKVELTKCQLGLFGYPGKQGWDEAGVVGTPLPRGMEEAVRGSLDEEGNLACAKAWKIAQQFNISRIQMGWYAEHLGAQIAPCQLGAFDKD